MFVSLIGITTAFLFDTKCVATPPCTCSREFIYCNRKQLLQFPVFAEHQEHHTDIYVRLDNNQFSTVPAYAFKNLSVINTSHMYVHLENNRIDNIDIHAFTGIETAVTYLNLEHNNLTHLPPTLGVLSSLNYLFLLDNPLVSLEAIDLASISSKLRTLTVSIDQFVSFPNELHVLTALLSLQIDNMKFPTLNSTVFDSFEISLNTFEMSYANFERIPVAFCRLKALHEVTFDQSPNLGNDSSSIFDECTHSMPTITVLSLQFDALTALPKFSSVFPRLTKLNLNNNFIEFIDWREIICRIVLSNQPVSGRQTIS